MLDIFGCFMFTMFQTVSYRDLFIPELFVAFRVKTVRCIPKRFVTVRAEIVSYQWYVVCSKQSKTVSCWGTASYDSRWDRFETFRVDNVSYSVKLVCWNRFETVRVKIVSHVSHGIHGQDRKSCVFRPFCTFVYFMFKPLRPFRVVCGTSGCNERRG